MNEDFHCLDLREKVNLVRKKGHLLVTTDFYGAVVKLFHLNMRYIEMYHHPVTNKIMRVSFASLNDLDKHLRRIRI